MLTVILLTSLITAILVASTIVLILRGALKGIISRLVGEIGSIYWCRLVCFTVFLYGLQSGLSSKSFGLSAQFDQEPGRLDFRIVAYFIYTVAEQTLTGITYALIAFFAVAIIVFIIVRILEVIAELIQRSRT